jgi:hypothetical protein
MHVGDYHPTRIIPLDFSAFQRVSGMVGEVAPGPIMGNTRWSFQPGTTAGTDTDPPIGKLRAPICLPEGSKIISVFWSIETLDDTVTFRVVKKPLDVLGGTLSADQSEGPAAFQFVAQPLGSFAEVTPGADLAFSLEIENHGAGTGNDAALFYGVKLIVSKLP